MNKICVVKRDGSTEIFQAQKIYAAVAKAFDAAGDDRYSEYFFPLDAFEGRENVGVEEIQNAVVESLRVKFPNVATKYAEYRDKRERERKVLHTLMSKIEEVSVASSKDVDLKRENANVNGDGAMGMMLRIGSESAKAFYLNNLIDPKFADAHINGDIHIHDLDFYPMTTTCCQIDLKKLLEGGFGTGHGKLREPTGILSASALACIAIQSNQNDQHGGQSIPNFDYGLAPYVAKTFEKYYVEFLADEIDRLQFRRLRDTDVKGIERFVASINDELKKKGRGARYFPNIDKGNLEGKRRDLYNECVYGRAEERQELCSLLFGRLDEKELDDKLYQFARAQRRAQDKAKAKTERETYQAMEALVHNLNSMHSRAGAQVPFSSINYGTDVSPEGFLVTESVLLAHEAGLGNGETPIFPIRIFRVKKGINFNEGEPNYYLFKLACRVSARRMFPNFVFQDAPFNLKYYDPERPETEIAQMGCRTRVIGNVHDPEREITYSRGNLSFTSINLPRLAINFSREVLNGQTITDESPELENFLERVREKVDLCCRQLRERLRFQSECYVYNFPSLMGQGCWIDSEKLSKNDKVGEVLKYGTLSVGFIGLAETLKVLCGAHHGESDVAQKVGLKIVGAIRDFLDERAKDERLNYTALATPAEGLSGRFVRMDKKLFGEIPGVTDKDFYTNSFHVPVEFKVSAFDKIRTEAPYHELTNAGHITYVELDGDASQNLAAFEKIVRAMEAAGIGYGAINHPIDRDDVCGFDGIINGEICPKCGRRETKDEPFSRIRRITGYLVGTLDRFNDAKRAEEKMRIKHDFSDKKRQNVLKN